jgi:hypothetical protein
MGVSKNETPAPVVIPFFKIPCVVIFPWYLPRITGKKIVDFYCVMPLAMGINGIGLIFMLCNALGHMH